MSAIDTIDTNSATIGARPRLTRAWFFAFVRLISASLAARCRKQRSRATLRHLTQDQLRDIGLTRSDVRRELEKSFFWD